MKSAEKRPAAATLRRVAMRASSRAPATRCRAPTRLATTRRATTARDDRRATTRRATTTADADEETQDAQARKMAIEFAVIADDTRAVEVQVLSVAKSVFYARYVVLATAFNRPQMNACCAKMRELANEAYGLTVPKSAAQVGDWACLDCADVVVHVFSPNSRTHYDLDGLYKGAERVELPFVTETRGGSETEDEFEPYDEEEDEEDDEFEVFE
jgi:ribosome silencing factor RsfS/YbeB/iojap